MRRGRPAAAVWTAALVVGALAALLGIATLLGRMHDAWSRGVTPAPGAAPPTVTAAPPSVPAPGATAGRETTSSTTRAAGGDATVTPATAVPWLRARALLVPVRGVEAGDLRSTFHEARGDRRHEALDIMAPAGTPVQAVDDGTVARLFTSAAGGLTVYQFDPTRSVAYYYAHLERYAPDLADGAPVRRGQVLGYVGSTGNADPAAPHLHFAISVLGPGQRWWEGTPIDPCDVIR